VGVEETVNFSSANSQLLGLIFISRAGGRGREPGLFLRRLIALICGRWVLYESEYYGFLA